MKSSRFTEKSRRTDSNSADMSRVSINGIVASGRTWFGLSHQLLCLLSHSSVATPVDKNKLCKSGIFYYLKYSLLTKSITWINETAMFMWEFYLKRPGLKIEIKM